MGINPQPAPDTTFSDEAPLCSRQVNAVVVIALRFRVENLLILHLRQHFCHQPTVNKIPVLVIHYRPTSVKK
ncbi:Uncharacterised protein [Shigella sonnei]|nr:Uncharacterised protein [Shigella sonnei]